MIITIKNGNDYLNIHEEDFNHFKKLGWVKCEKPQTQTSKKNKKVEEDKD